jgi:hypothetical protein
MKAQTQKVKKDIYIGRALAGMFVGENSNDCRMEQSIK